MSVQRSPPSAHSQQLLAPNITTQHYNSDSAINKLSTEATDEQYFNITKRQKRTFNDLVDQSSTSSSELKALISDLKEQQDNKFELLNNALLTIVSQNQDIQKSITVLTKQNEDLRIELKEIKEENITFKQQISQLQNRLDFFEKKSCYTAIEIRNLPLTERENKKDLIKIVQNIGVTIGLDTSLQECEIKDIRRKKQDTIVVDFTTALRKESIISHYKLYNKSRRERKQPLLCSDQIKMTGTPCPIYVSEYLTTNMRRIFYLAREGVKSKSLVACWSSYGKVYVKKVETARPVCITAESELQKILL